MEYLCKILLMKLRCPTEKLAKSDRYKIFSFRDFQLNNEVLVYLALKHYSPERVSGCTKRREQRLELHLVGDAIKRNILTPPLLYTTNEPDIRDGFRSAEQMRRTSTRMYSGQLEKTNKKGYTKNLSLNRLLSH